MRFESAGELGESTAELLREWDRECVAPAEVTELNDSRRDTEPGRGCGEAPLSMDAMLVTTLSPLVCASGMAGGCLVMGDKVRWASLGEETGLSKTELPVMVLDCWRCE